MASSVKGSIAYLCTDAGNVNYWLINARSLFSHHFSCSLSTLPVIVSSSCFLQVVLLYLVYFWDWFFKVYCLVLYVSGRRIKSLKNKYDLLIPKDWPYLIYGDDGGDSLISDRREEAQ